MNELVRVRVGARTDAADGVVALTLEHPDGERLPDWTPGAHVDLVLPTGLTRQYSLCGDRFDPHRYRVAMLREADGRGGSAWVHDRLQVGDELAIGGPRNHFPLVPASSYLFLAGGIGITPLLPMIAQAEQLGADWRLVYGGRSRASMAFTGELAGYGDAVRLVGGADLDLAAELAEPVPGRRVYCCGPPGLLAAVERACAHWPPYSLHTELFAAGEPPAPARSTPFDVELARTGGVVSVGPDRTVLDAVRSAGADVLSSCRSGTCGTCDTTVLAGVPDHRDRVLTDEERAAGDAMLVCVSRARSDRLVLDL